MSEGLTTFLSVRKQLGTLNTFMINADLYSNKTKLNDSTLIYLQSAKNTQMTKLTRYVVLKQ